LKPGFIADLDRVCENTWRSLYETGAEIYGDASVSYAASEPRTWSALDGMQRQDAWNACSPTMSMDNHGRFLQDPAEQTDDNLLALLGSLAGHGDVDDDGFAAGVLPLLPLEVQFEEPAVRPLIEGCSVALRALHDEVLVATEIRVRDVEELWRLQKRREVQLQECDAMMQRLNSASESVSEKVQESFDAQHELRARISFAEEESARLVAGLPEAIEMLHRREAALQQSLADAETTQAKLAQELLDAEEATRRLRLELDAERASSSDVCRTSEELWGGLRSELKADEEAQADCLTPSGASPDPVAQVEGKCWHQLRRIAELREELAMEEASRAHLDDLLEDAEARTAISEVQLCGVVPSPEEEPDPLLPDDRAALDLAGGLHEAEQIWRSVQESLALRVEMCEKEQLAQAVLKVELQELSEISAQVLNEENVCEEQEQDIARYNAFLNVIRNEIKTEQGALRDEEQAADQKLKQLRKQIEESQRELLWRRDEAQEMLQLQRRGKSGFGLLCGTSTKTPGHRKEVPDRM